MSTRERVGVIWHTVGRWWIPDSLPPRLSLFFIATAVFALAAVLTGLFVRLRFMHNVAVAVSAIVLCSIGFAILFAMSRRETDQSLLKHRQRLLAVSRVVAVALALGTIGMVAVILSLPSRSSHASVHGQVRIRPVISDAIALTWQANQILFKGANPYGHTNIIQAMEKFVSVAPTPLRQGVFADVYPAPTEEQIQEALRIAKANPGVPPLEFDSALSYPAGSFLLRIPFDALSIDARWFYAVCALAVAAIIVWKAPKHLRPVAVVASLASVLVWNSQFGGGTDSLFILFVLLAWTLRRRLWLAAVLMGIACSCKQTAWFFALFYIILILRESGWRQAAKSTATIGATFALINLPFVVADPAAWIKGVLGPMSLSEFPWGMGVSSLAALTSTPVRSEIFTALEIVVLVVGLAWYYRNCRQAPQSGLVLAILPLFFAWRSLLAYFVMIPLLVFGAVLIDECSQSLEVAQSAG